MTTNSDGVTPNPGEQPITDPAADPAAAPLVPPQPTPEPEEVDIDTQAVIDAQAAAEAEEAAGGGADGAIVDPGQQPQPQAPAAPPQDQPQRTGQQRQPQSGEPVTIPKPRFDEALSQRDNALQEAAYWRGVAEAGRQPAGTGQPGAQQQPQPQQPTADQRLAEIQSHQDALAAKFDNGEITFADLTRQTRDLTNKEQAIREEILIAKVKPAAGQQQQPAAQDELYLRDKTDEIKTQHPWVDVYEQVGTVLDWKYVRDRAAENLKERGVDAYTPSGKLELRKEVAVLMDELGPAMIAKKAKAANVAIPGQQPGQQQQQPPAGGARQPAPLSPIALARQAKLATEANQPPNLSRMAGTPTDATTPTDAAIETMSEDAYDALPDATRNKLLGLV
jgi:hypothetical protein